MNLTELARMLEQGGAAIAATPDPVKTEPISAPRHARTPAEAGRSRQASRRPTRRELTRSLPCGFTVRPGRLGREGVVEIEFDTKPDEPTRTELKSSGFRWAKTNGCWYGPQARLPRRYA